MGGTLVERISGLRRTIAMELGAQRLRAEYERPTPIGVIMTMLAETEQIGGTVGAAAIADLPSTYLRDGARVPEDIHDAGTETVLDALLPEAS